MILMQNIYKKFNMLRQKNVNGILPSTKRWFFLPKGNNDGPRCSAHSSEIMLLLFFNTFPFKKILNLLGQMRIKTRLIALCVFKCAFSMYSNSLNIWSHQFVKCQLFDTPLLSQFLVILTFILRGGVCMETNS